jgi:molybdopterin synthase catalytic subunit
MSTHKVLFFATLKERAGVHQTSIEFPDGMTVRELRLRIGAQFPSLAPHLSNALIAVNREYAPDDVVLPREAEIAFFPPVSGGSSQGTPSAAGIAPTVCIITEDSLDLNAVAAQITAPTTGAVVVFTGMVRAITSRDNPHETTYLEYEAYNPMAEAMMHQIADEIRSRWPSVEGIVLVQRIGRLEPGTPTTAIACAAAHRDTGVFEAARYGIDRLKEIVPVWKKEVGSLGQVWIEGKHRPTENPK